MHQDYTSYLASEEWQAKRLARQTLDGNRCRICNSNEQLEVHHRSYKRIFNEDVDDDLTTLCYRCHEAVRAIREECKLETQVDGEKIASGRVALARMTDYLTSHVTHVSTEINERITGFGVVVIGIITKISPVTTKSGETMAFIKMEDRCGIVNITVFPELYSDERNRLALGRIIAVSGRVDVHNNRISVVADYIRIVNSDSELQ